MLLLIAVGLFITGYTIAARHFKHPMARLFGGLAISAGLCVIAVGILFAGCLLVMHR